MAKKTDEFPPDEIARRMNEAVRRALHTPPISAKELIGKSERAQAQRETKRIRKARQSKPETS